MASDLPPELGELERRLAGRPGPDPALRSRVLKAVDQALVAERRGRWRFLLTTAAAAVLGVNLSMSMGLNGGWQERDDTDLESASHQVRLLYPGMSDDEIRREALLLRAGGQLTPGPDVGAAAAKTGVLREGDSWGMR